MDRTVLLTGSASGIGEATAKLLAANGWRVIGVNRRGGEIVADQSTPQGRAKILELAPTLARGALNAVIANAGVTFPSDLIVRCNFFGTVSVVEGLRAELAKADAPRAVVVGSVGLVHACDDSVIEACLDRDEAAAVSIVGTLHPAIVYTSVKRALSRWLRGASIGPKWAGCGIPLNMIAPGVVDTPAMHETVSSEEGRARLEAAGYPMPLGGIGLAEHVAPALQWAVSPENYMMTGQVIFVDGGTEAVVRGDDIFG